MSAGSSVRALERFGRPLGALVDRTTQQLPGISQQVEEAPAGIPGGGCERAHDSEYGDLDGVGGGGGCLATDRFHEWARGPPPSGRDAGRDSRSASQHLSGSQIGLQAQSTSDEAWGMV